MAAPADHKTSLEQSSHSADTRVELVYRDSRGQVLEGLTRRMRVDVTVQEDGSLVVADPSPLRGMTPQQREGMILSVLELRAMRGNLTAADAWLRHRRWAREMRSGKARQKVQHQHDARIVVVNDLSPEGRKDVVDIMPSSRTLKGKKGESRQLEAAPADPPVD